MARQRSAGRTPTCPDWCVVRHDRRTGEDHHLHIGGALMVRRTVMRLCATIDPATGAQDGPFVLVGAAEFTLYEAEALIAALTQLVDQGGSSLLAQQPQGAVPVLDP